MEEVFLMHLRALGCRLKRSQYLVFTIWLFNIAMENGPFIDGFPIKTSIYKGFSMAMLNNQRVYNEDALGFIQERIEGNTVT